LHNFALNIKAAPMNTSKESDTTLRGEPNSAEPVANEDGKHDDSRGSKAWQASACTSGCDDFVTSALPRKLA
jgi:hypothetical protein